jgi:hypothetical protein
MAEPVGSLLRRSLDHVEHEAPASYRHLLDTLGPLVIGIDVDGERFALRGGARLEVIDGRVGGMVDGVIDAVAGTHVALSRAAILAVLDAELGLAEAVETGRIAVRGRLDDVVRTHDTLIAYAHAAVRAPSVPALMAQLRGGSGGAP